MSDTALIPSDRIEKLSRAANPALFEAAIDPQLLTVLMLANLMSPTLWQLKDKILDRARAAYPNEAHLQQRHITAEMLAYVNHHFTHDYPMSTAEKVGVTELADIRQRLGSEGVNYALDVIRQHFRRRDEQGLLTPALDIFPVLNQDKFPIFNYSTIDGLRAMRLLLGHKKHKPMGVTICADEATLVAALANILHGVSFEDIFLLGTPAHYTTFLHKGGQRVWCNGKLEYFDQATWQKMCAAPGALGPQAAFAKRLPFLDRLISPLGDLLISTGECTIPERVFDAFLDESRIFFGGVLNGIQSVIDTGITFLPSQVALEDLKALDDLSSAEEARLVISEIASGRTLSVFDQALYCTRDIHVSFPGAYLAAALRGPKLRAAAATVTSLQSACENVAKITATEAVLSDRHKIALPDEVLLFQTGDDVDKGLLLISLLMSSSAISSSDKSSATLSVTDRSTFCQIADQIIDLKNLGPVAVISGTEQMRLGQGAMQL